MKLRFILIVIFSMWVIQESAFGDPSYVATISNTSSASIFVAVKTWADHQFQVQSWFEVKPDSTSRFEFTDSACVAIARDQRDWIRQQEEAGFAFNMEKGRLRSHPAYRTDLDYGSDSQGLWTVNAMVRGEVSESRHYDGLTKVAVRSSLDSIGLDTFECFRAERSDLFTVVDQ